MIKFEKAHSHAGVWCLRETSFWSHGDWIFVLVVVLVFKPNEQDDKGRGREAGHSRGRQPQ